MIARSVLLAVALVLAACGQLPQPFSKERANLAKAPFLIAPATEGVIVWPMIGVDDDIAEIVTEMTVAALQDRGVVASATTSNQASLLLTTVGNRLPDGALEVTWTLSRPDGSVVGTRVDAIASDARFEEAVTEVAGWIVPVALPEVDEEAPLSVAVYDVHGAPGNGNALLRRAMGFALVREEVEVTGFPGPDGYVVQGDVTLEPHESGGELVTVSWVVMDAQGQELGTVDQANTVPPGYLARDWGPVAAPIADAAVEGVVALIRRHLSVVAVR
jgi:hypothetical protein